ncbi:hypothetical protein ACSBR2_028741 [Camellia fascicularis]
MEGLVVLYWGLGHCLKMDRLGLVRRHWSGMNIAGTEVRYYTILYYTLYIPLQVI